ncbi:hypothetical protein VNI00_004799 [Paramarasmius palmivorus]|uniref:Uncharacterized protein n=1 Tax=Paramarasmius palmivorus TaxID=297713 RepID=A0AAW0DKG8_9AGAR
MSSPNALKGHSARGRLALLSVYEDSVATGRAKGADHVYKTIFDDQQRATPDVVIDKFWNNPKNQDVVDAFMNNTLCNEAAKGNPDAIAAYKKYAVQDYFYLVDWFKFKVLRLAVLPHDDFDFDDLSDELDSVHDSLKSYVVDWFTTCIKPEAEGGLGLSADDFQVERTVGEIAYGQSLQNNARQDDWYNLHIILIGCYWAWSKLGVKLYNDPTTVKDTIFYNNWILPNVKVDANGTAEMADSANALSLFLDQNASTYASTITEEQAQELFRAALRLEVGLFNSAYDPSVIKPVPLSPGIPGLPKQKRQGPHSRGAWKRLLGLKTEGDDANEGGVGSR